MAHLRDICVETHLGANYVFPDVDLSVPATRTALRDLGGRHDVTIGNVSGAVLVIPLRLIKRLYTVDEVLWLAPA